MQVAVLEDRGRIVIEEADVPTVGPTDILIRVAYAGVCGSDLHAFKGLHPFRQPPVILGHELSGTIVEIGRGVRGFSVGDRVTVMPYLSCGQCIYCQRGRSNICLNKTVPGIKGWLGTFAEYFSSRPEITYLLGESTSLERGALAEPLAVAVHSVAQGRVGAGSSVLILGSGTIGLLTAVAAQMAGATTVVATDLYEYNLAMARELGVDGAYDAVDEKLEETIRSHHPQGFDVVFLTGGAAVTVGQGLGLIQRAGRMVITAMFMEPVPVDLLDMTLNEIELIGTQIYTGADFEKALAWLDEGAFPFDKLVDHVLPLDRAQEALQMLEERQEDAVKVLLTPER